MTPTEIQRLYEQSGAARWGVATDTFAEALEASVAHAFAGRERTRSAVDRYISSLHVADLGIACACLHGSSEAWDAFVRDYRPLLYRAADALEPSGGAREIADALYAELYERRLLAYFHGRSSLATWLRAVLSQRYVDRVRARRREEPLTDDEAADVPVAPAPRAASDLDRARLFPLLVRALHVALAALEPRERFRLQCYYAQDLTLAQTGRLLGEHEATVSRQLTRARRTIRQSVERHLREQARLSDAEIAACFDTAVTDPGPLNLHRLLGRKNSAADRSS